MNFLILKLIINWRMKINFLIIPQIASFCDCIMHSSTKYRFIPTFCRRRRINFLLSISTQLNWHLSLFCDRYFLSSYDGWHGRDEHKLRCIRAHNLNFKFLRICPRKIQIWESIKLSNDGAVRICGFTFLCGFAIRFEYRNQSCEQQ